MKNDINEKPPLLIASVTSSAVIHGDCVKNIHWYIGKYIKGIHYYNECAYCKKRQLIDLD